MSPENTKYLNENFPKIFPPLSLPAAALSYPPIMFGFEVGDGWFLIIKGLCISIQNHIDSNRREIESAKSFNAVLDRGETPKWWNESMGPLERRKVPRKIPQPTALQIKEKFGTLRVYMSGYSTAIDSFIYLAEVMSSIMCEGCGAKSEVNYEGNWNFNLCQSCQIKRDEKYA